MRPCGNENVSKCFDEGCLNLYVLTADECQVIKRGPVVCRCGRREKDPGWHDHPIEIPRLCRWGLHKWSGLTMPAAVKWCYRCGQKASVGGTFLIDKNVNKGQ